MIVCVHSGRYRKLQENQVFQHNCSLIGNPDAQTSVWGCAGGREDSNFPPWHFIRGLLRPRTGGHLSVGCSLGTRASRIYSRPKPGHQLQGCRRQAMRFKTSQADGENNLALRFPVWPTGSQLYGCFLGLCTLFEIFPHQGYGSNATVVCLIFEIGRVGNLLVFYVNSAWSCGDFIFTSLETWHELLRIQMKKDLCLGGFLLAIGICDSHRNSMREMNSCGVPKWRRLPCLFSKMDTVVWFVQWHLSGRNSLIALGPPHPSPSGYILTTVVDLLKTLAWFTCKSLRMNSQAYK